MRDRLRKLIYESDILCDDCGESTSSYCAEAIADHLLANGVIVPNVAIGTKIYAVPLYPRGVYEFEVADIDKKYVCRGGWVFTDTHLGKTTFLTKEEAEKALKEREGKG